MKKNLIPLALPILKYTMVTSGAKIPTKAEFPVYVEAVFGRVQGMVDLTIWTEAEVKVHIAQFFSAVLAGYSLSLQDPTTNGSFPMHVKNWEHHDLIAYAIHKELCERGHWGYQHLYLKVLKENVADIALAVHLKESDCLDYFNAL